MRLAGRLIALSLGIAAFSTAVALYVQDGALAVDLERSARARLANASAVVDRLVSMHLSQTRERYQAISRTPELRANLEVGHRPTLSHYARRLAETQGATAVLFFDAAQGSVSEDSLGIDLGRIDLDGAKLFDVDGQPHVAVGVPLLTADRVVGSLIALERVDQPLLDDWSQLSGAEVGLGPTEETENSLVTTLPPTHGMPLGVKMSTAAERLALMNSRRNLLVAGAVALAIALLASVVFSRGPVKSIRGVSAVAGRIGHGDFAARIQSNRRDEIGDVARCVDDMAERLERLDFLQMLLDGLPDAVLLVGFDGSVMRSNPVAQRMGGQVGFWWDLLDPPARERARSLLLEMREPGPNIKQLETGIASQDGRTWLWALVGLGHAVLASGRDVSDLKEAEQERVRYERESTRLEAEVQAMEKEKEVTRLKSRFVSMASHEFRTPLTAILASSELLERYHDRLSEEQRLKRLAQIGMAVHQMTTLLEDVLTINSSDPKHARLEPETLDLPQLCLKIVDEVQATTGAQDRIRLVNRLADSTTVVEARYLRKILGNLLSNAIKYSPEGRPVELEVERAVDSLVFRIRDHGIGIPKEDHARLFEAFHRGTNVGSASGSGLGLTIVKTAVDVYGGSITFETSPGSGTTFVVSVPAIVEPSGAPEEPT